MQLHLCALSENNGEYCGEGERRASGWSSRSDRTLLYQHHQPSLHWECTVSSWDGGPRQASDDFLSLYFPVALVSFFMILLGLVLTESLQ